MASPETRPRIPYSWRVVGWTSAVLIAVVAALWLVWGFRWPPTSDVVSRPEPEAYTPPPEAPRSER